MRRDDRPYDKSEGHEEIQRWLQQNFGLSATSALARGFAVLAAPFVLKTLIGRMILAVARKPQSP